MLYITADQTDKISATMCGEINVTTLDGGHHTTGLEAGDGPEWKMSIKDIKEHIRRQEKDLARLKTKVSSMEDFGFTEVSR
tara:strand:- start:3323 stop:3565 length:243 start_codon:yes stop_codon:yes gene_type:complete